MFYQLVLLIQHWKLMSKQLNRCAGNTAPVAAPAFIKATNHMSHTPTLSGKVRTMHPFTERTLLY